MTNRKVATVGSFSIYRSAETGEFIVRRPGAPREEGYYTDNKADAIATATHLDALANAPTCPDCGIRAEIHSLEHGEYVFPCRCDESYLSE